MAKKRRRRKKRYHTGVYVSTKTGKECRYRSGWELSYLQHLDADPSVVSFAYEELAIPYVSNVRTGKLRRYYPDVLVDFIDGTQKLIEIKPKRKLDQVKIVKKLKAAREWCRVHNVTFEVITEVELKAMDLL